MRHSGVVLLALAALLAGPAAQAGLVAYYDMEDGSGTSVSDVTGNGHTGTLQGTAAPDWVASHDGSGALDLSGGQHVTTINSAANQLNMDGNKPKTVALWANVRSFNNGGLFDLGHANGAGQEFCLRTKTNNTGFRAQFWSSPDFDFNAPDSNGAWRHYVLLHDGSQGMAFYDGRLIAGGRSTVNTQSNRNFEIGRYRGGSTLDGIVDDVAAYDEALQPNQVAYLAGGGDPTALPAPEPGLFPLLGVGPDGSEHGLWGIREVRNNGTLNSVYDARDSLLSGGGTIVDGSAPVVNHNDPQNNGGGGHFGDASKAPFLGNVSGNDEDVAFLARSKVIIPTDGWYTFGFRSDDGALLKLVGADFEPRWGALAFGDTVVFPGNTGDSNTGAAAFLEAGEYPAEFLYYERGGGAYVELWAAPGDFSSFDPAAFALVGDTANGGLQLTPEPTTLSLLGLGLLAALRRRRRA
ncbi:MAG: LamG-like jellyroll fold domain-containing protein [Planctomycetota bacterium]